MKQEEKQKLFFNNLKYKSNKYKISNKFLQSKNICYVYFLINFNEIVYIGKSVNYEARLTAHGFNYNLIRTIKTNTNLAEKWEKKLIKKYQPIHNKLGVFSYKTQIHTKHEYYYPFTPKIRKIDSLKPKLNIQFENKYDDFFPYRGKDSRNYYLSYEQFLKNYKAKFWCKSNRDNLIIFFCYKPSKKDLLKTNTTQFKIYPTSIKPEVR